MDSQTTYLKTLSTISLNAEIASLALLRTYQESSKGQPLKIDSSLPYLAVEYLTRFENYAATLKEADKIDYFSKKFIEMNNILKICDLQSMKSIAKDHPGEFFSAIVKGWDYVAYEERQPSLCLFKVIRLIVIQTYGSNMDLIKEFRRRHLNGYIIRDTFQDSSLPSISTLIELWDISMLKRVLQTSKGKEECFIYRSFKGLTVLHLAVYHENLEAVEAILEIPESRSLLTVRSNKRFTPYEYAMWKYLNYLKDCNDGDDWMVDMKRIAHTLCRAVLESDS